MGCLRKCGTSFFPYKNLVRLGLVTRVHVLVAQVQVGRGLKSKTKKYHAEVIEGTQRFDRAEQQNDNAAALDRLDGARQNVWRHGLKVLFED